MSRSVVAVYSGGLDSTTMLWHLRREGVQMRALTVDYGQRHRREIEHARRLAARLGIEHRVADLRAIQGLLAGSSLTSEEVAVPHGHYTEASMKATVVPNRNMILLAVAAGWAIASGCDAVAYAAHGGDHAIYPDCRDAFAEAMDRALHLCDWSPIALERPFLGWTKADVVERAHELGVPLEATWSCYEGGEHHCGRCGTCIERREAFYLAGLPDPTTYDAAAPRVETLLAHNWRLPT